MNSLETNSSDVSEEIALVCAVFEGEAVCTGPRELIVTVAMNARVRICVPLTGYPDERAPTASVIDGPNAVIVSLLDASLRQRFATDELCLGAPMLAHMVTVVKDEASSLQEQIAQERSRSYDVGLDSQNEEGRCGVESLCPTEGEGPGSPESGIAVYTGEPIVDRKSKFVAHLAAVRSEEEVQLVIRQLRSNKSIAAAAHPTIYAYRFVDSRGVLHQDSDDDGETGAAKKVLFLMDAMKAVGCVVVVTRWFGGILLGPDRFKHIMTCAKQVIVQHGLHAAEA